MKKNISLFYTNIENKEGIDEFFGVRRICRKRD